MFRNKKKAGKQRATRKEGALLVLVTKDDDDNNEKVNKRNIKKKKNRKGNIVGKRKSQTGMIRSFIPDNDNDYDIIDVRSTVSGGVTQIKCRVVN